MIASASPESGTSSHPLAARGLPRAALWRRAEPRAAHRTPCRVHLLLDDLTEQAFTGLTVNVSLSGICLHVPFACMEGAKLRVELVQAEGGRLEVHGTVAHCRRVLSGTYELGVVSGGAPEP